jgi:TRAP transporter TAXI family solute receptor
MKRLFVSSLAVLLISGWAQEVKQIRYVVGTMGSTYYNLGVIIANVLEKNLNLKIAVQPSGGSSAQALLLSQGEADIGMIPAAHAFTLRNGSKGYEKGFPNYIGKATPIRLLVVGQTLPFGILMRKSSWVESTLQLKGKTIFGTTPSSAGFEMASRGYLEAAGLEYNKDVKILAMGSSSEGVNRVIAGDADGVVTSFGGAKIREFAAKDGGWYTSAPIDPKSMAIYNKYYPAVIAWTAEKDGPCMKKGTSFFGFPDYFHTTSKLSDEMAYNITKALLNNLSELQKMSPIFKEWSLKGAVKDPKIPFHPGAIKYYKEKGVWNAGLDERQQALLKEGL